MELGRLVGWTECEGERYVFALNMAMPDAGKVARLTRSGTARDASDLAWPATTSPHFGFDRSLARTLAPLKVWADNHGPGAGGSRPYRRCVG